MGIVMKRRDNAPIVKHVFGNIIERILSSYDINMVRQWLEKTLDDINIMIMLNIYCIFSP